MNTTARHAIDTHAHVVVMLMLVAAPLFVSCTRRVASDTSSSSGDVNGSIAESRERNYDSLSEFELSQLVSTAAEPILVEFGTDFNCARCEQMMPVVNDLQREFDGQARIVRANFNPSSAFQAKLGIRFCPSYVFYRRGKIVDRCDGPTMLPVLKSKLSRLVSVAENRADSSSPRVKLVGVSQ